MNFANHLHRLKRKKHLQQTQKNRTGVWAGSVVGGVHTSVRMDGRGGGGGGGSMGGEVKTRWGCLQGALDKYQHHTTGTPPLAKHKFSSMTANNRQIGGKSGHKLRRAPALCLLRGTVFNSGDMGWQVRKPSLCG